MVVTLKIQREVAMAKTVKTDKTFDGKFAIGSGATVVMWTDRMAYTVIEVSPSGKQMKIQRDIATLINKDELKVNVGGFAANVSGEQKYTYEPDPTGDIRTVRFVISKMRPQGVWKADKFGIAVAPGRAEFYDYNF